MPMETPKGQWRTLPPRRSTPPVSRETVFTVLGGEPFFQPVALAALLRAFKARGAHTVVYSGYTLETLHRRPEPEVSEALRLVDLLIDGPFIAALAEGAGEWRGSRNQRVLALVGARTVTPQDEFRRQ